MNKREEFPELTPEAQRAFYAADRFRVDLGPWWFRRCLAAFLREAMKQALDKPGEYEECWDELIAIADNLHNPSPPPTTLAQARAADLDTPAGKAVVRDFLATLGEGGQL